MSRRKRPRRGGSKPRDTAPPPGSPEAPRPEPSRAEATRRGLRRSRPISIVPEVPGAEGAAERRRKFFTRVGAEADREEPTGAAGGESPVRRWRWFRSSSRDAGPATDMPDTEARAEAAKNAAAELRSHLSRPPSRPATRPSASQPQGSGTGRRVTGSLPRAGRVTGPVVSPPEPTPLPAEPPARGDGPAVEGKWTEPAKATLPPPFGRNRAASRPSSAPLFPRARPATAASPTSSPTPGPESAVVAPTDVAAEAGRSEPAAGALAAATAAGDAASSTDGARAAPGTSPAASSSTTAGAPPDRLSGPDSGSSDEADPDAARATTGLASAGEADRAAAGSVRAASSPVSTTDPPRRPPVDERPSTGSDRQARAASDAGRAAERPRRARTDDGDRVPLHDGDEPPLARASREILAPLVREADGGRVVRADTNAGRAQVDADEPAAPILPADEARSSRRARSSSLRRWGRPLTELLRPPAWQRHDLLVVLVAAALFTTGAIAQRRIATPSLEPTSQLGLQVSRPSGWLPPRRVGRPSGGLADASDVARNDRPDDVAGPAGSSIPHHIVIQSARDPFARLEIRVAARPTTGNLRSALVLERVSRHGEAHWAADSTDRTIGGRDWVRTEYRYAYKGSKTDAPRIATGIEYALVNGRLLYTVTVHGSEATARQLEALLVPTLSIDANHPAAVAR